MERPASGRAPGEFIVASNAFAPVAADSTAQLEALGGYQHGSAPRVRAVLAGAYRSPPRPPELAQAEQVLDREPRERATGLRRAAPPRRARRARRGGRRVGREGRRGLGRRGPG